MRAFRDLIGELKGDLKEKWHHFKHCHFRRSFWALLLLLATLTPTVAAFCLLGDSCLSQRSSERYATDWNSSVAACREEFKEDDAKRRNENEEKSPTRDEVTSDSEVQDRNGPAKKEGSEKAEEEQAVPLFLQMAVDASRSVDEYDVFKLTQRILQYGLVEGDCVRLIAIADTPEPIEIGGSPYYLKPKESDGATGVALSELLSVRKEKGGETDLVEVLKMLRSSEPDSGCSLQGKEFNTVTVIASDFVHDKDEIGLPQVQEILKELVRDHWKHVLTDVSRPEALDVLNQTFAIELLTRDARISGEERISRGRLLKGFSEAGVRVMAANWPGDVASIESLFSRLRQARKLELSKSNKCDGHSGYSESPEDYACVLVKNNLGAKNLAVHFTFVDSSSEPAVHKILKAEQHFAIRYPDSLQTKSLVDLRWSISDPLYSRYLYPNAQISMNRERRGVEFRVNRSRKLWFVYPDREFKVTVNFKNSTDSDVCVFPTLRTPAVVGARPAVVKAGDLRSAKDVRLIPLVDKWDSSRPFAENFSLDFQFLARESVDIEDLEPEDVRATASMSAEGLPMAFGLIQPGDRRASIHEFLKDFQIDRVFWWAGALLFALVLFYIGFVRGRVPGASAAELAAAALSMIVVCGSALTLYIPYEYYVAGPLGVPHMVNRWLLGLILAFALVELMRLLAIRIIDKKFPCRATKVQHHEIPESAEEDEPLTKVESRTSEVKVELMKSVTPNWLVAAIFVLLELYALPNFL